MRLKSWQSLLLRARALTLEVEDRRDRIEERKDEFERLVAKDLGVDLRKPPPTPPVEPGLTVWSDGPEAKKDLPESDEPKAPRGEPGDDLGKLLEDPETSKGPECPPAIRRVYAMIVSRTHPDKTGGDLGLVLLYRKAVQAKERGAFEEILDIAFELCLDLPYEDDLIPYIERRIQALSGEIQRIGSLLIWHWLDAPDQAARDGIIRTVAQKIRTMRR